MNFRSSVIFLNPNDKKVKITVMVTLLIYLYYIITLSKYV